MGSDLSYIEVHIEGYIGTIVFDRPRSRNAFNSRMIAEISSALDAMQEKGVRVVVFRAVKGSSIWSAGYDIKELANTKDQFTSDQNDPLEFLLQKITHFPAPVIAMVHGSVWGGACEFALSCDLVFGDPTCSFAVTPANLGVPYSARGILRFLNRLPLNIVKEMFFTARPIDAARAERISLLNFLVPEEELETFTYEMAREISNKSPLTLSSTKEQARILCNAVPLRPEVWEYMRKLCRSVYGSADYQEGVKAFQEKRKAVFQGK